IQGLHIAIPFAYAPETIAQKDDGNSASICCHRYSDSGDDVAHHGCDAHGGYDDDYVPALCS
ncbi:MAG: hypothetical protein IKO82_03515, partial [Prevotella sp.]|nr:hypothetical protein [Prevotella sp.]